MVFKKIKKLEKCYKFFEINNQIFISKDNFELEIYTLSLDLIKIIKCDVEIRDGFLYQDKIYLIGFSNQIYTLENYEIKSYTDDFEFSDNKNIKNKINVFKGDVFNRQRGIYSLSDKKELWWTEKSMYLQLIGNFLIASINERRIIRFNIDNGEFLWETSFQEEYKDLRTNLFYVVYNKTLVLSLGEDILIGLHTDTGEILWQIDECNNTNYVLDEKDGKLKGVTSIGYFEVDIATGEYKRTLFEPMEKLFNDPTIFDSQRDNFVLVNNHIITTDCRRGIIGAFNIKTLQYDWFHEEEGVYFPSPRPIKYFEPYLFVTDNKDTLHIFKNDDENLTNV